MAKNNTALLLLLGMGMVLVMVSFSQASKTEDNVESLGKPSASSISNTLARFKRGYGGGGGGGGGHGGGSYGHGPGAGGGARGPVYFCGWVGSKMGSGGYGGYGK